MLSGLKHPKALTYVSFGCIAFLAFFMLGIHLASRNVPKRIKTLHTETQSLQQRLISAQITSERLKLVQKLISENMAQEGNDSLARGASLPFLTALTSTLDQLGISLVSLEPKATTEQGRFVEAPYHIELQCQFAQFAELVNRMEKSSRLISVVGFQLENPLDESLQNGQEQLRVTFDVTTLTLVKDL